MNYKHFGVMIDCSRNAVIKAAEVRRLIDFMAGMGYACLENFTQRCLYAPGRTVFGYMRGRYADNKLHEITPMPQNTALNSLGITPALYSTVFTVIFLTGETTPYRRRKYYAF